MKTSIWLVSALLAVACDPNEISAPGACPGGTASIKLAISRGANLAVPPREDLLVEGTLQKPAGVTIYRVFVGSVEAANKGFNYETFSAKITLDELNGLAKEKAGAEYRVATVEVRVLSNCEPGGYVATTFEVPMGRGRIDRLSFDTPAFSADADYLPAGNKGRVFLRLRANPEARGAVVVVSASAGAIEGTDAGRVTLMGDGKADATASFQFTAAADAVISAAAVEGSAMAPPLFIRVLGPPSLLPSAATLLPGQKIRASIVTANKGVTCQASPAAGISVTSGMTDLMATPGGADQSGDNLIDIDIAVSKMLANPIKTTVSCRDAYGQTATAVYEAITGM